MTEEERQLDLTCADLRQELAALRLDYQAACEARDHAMAEVRSLHMIIAELKVPEPELCDVSLDSPDWVDSVLGGTLS